MLDHRSDILRKIVQRHILHRPRAAAIPARLRPKYPESRRGDARCRRIEFLRIASQRRQHHDQRPAPLADHLDGDVVAANHLARPGLRVYRTRKQQNQRHLFHGYESIIASMDNSMARNRRTFLRAAGVALAGGLAPLRQLLAQTARSVQTPVLNIAYEESGPAQGFPIILLHGFPDDVRAFDEVVPPLAKAGYRVLVPYLRGYGPTRFLDPAAPRMAEQAAIGQDVIDFADALRLPRFAVSGFDWGGRAAAIAAVLHPDRVRAAVLAGGYTIQNTVGPSQPGPPEAERRIWYQYYFNTERGRAGLKANRRALCRLLWQTWSPNWHFTDETYNRTAVSFDNPDFVDVVIHSYRHRIGNAPGEKRFEAVEQQLAKRPRIQCPAITLYGADDGIATAAGGISTNRAGCVCFAGRAACGRRRGTLHASRKTGRSVFGAARIAGVDEVSPLTEDCTSAASAIPAASQAVPPLPVHSEAAPDPCHPSRRHTACRRADT